jgi:hypothetical protein
MSAPADTRLPAARGARVTGAVPRAVTRLRRHPPQERLALGLLMVLAVAGLVGSLELGVGVFPPAFQVVPLLFGGLLLNQAPMRRLSVVVAACLLWEAVALGLHVVRPGALVVVLVTGLIAYEFSRSREETGLTGLRGDSVLVELRRRLEQQGELPRLPAQWSAESVLKPAGGGPFAGDFVVSALTGCCSAVRWAACSGR